MNCDSYPNFGELYEEFGVLFSREAFFAVPFMGKVREFVEIGTGSTFRHLTWGFGWRIL